MADQIEVVDIKEDKQEEAPESKDEQTPEFNEVTEKVLQEEELNVIKEETQAEVQEEVQEETKPKTKTKKSNAALKEKATCPDCGISITMHGLKYTHQRYCKAKPKVVDIKEIQSRPPSPQELVRQKTSLAEIRGGAPIGRGADAPSSPAMVKVESLQTLIPTPEQIAAFLAQDRKMKAEKKISIMNNLIAQAF